MNKLLALVFILTFSCASFSQAKSDVHLKELKAIVKVDAKGKNEVFKTFIKVNKTLKKDMNEDVVKEVARVFTLLHKVDDNYYTVEPFTDLLKVKNSPFKMKMKKYLPKKDYEVFEENVESLLNEIKNGNG